MLSFKTYNFQSKEIIFYLIFYFSLLIGFLFGENSTGGAIIDYMGQKNVSVDFSNDFKKTLLNYESYATRHSPVLIFLLSGFEYLNFSDHVIRLIYLHLCLSLPVIFYLSIKEKYNFVSKEVLTILVGLIFISPTFRSLSIWPDSRIAGLIFFCLSVLFFIKFTNTKKFKYTIYNIISTSFASYLSPNFCIFSLFFLIFFARNYGFFSRQIYFLIILNIILAFPAFYYVFVLDIKFFMKSAAIGLEHENIFLRNMFNQLLIIPTIFLFYLTPFLILRIINIESQNLIYSFILSIIIFSLSLYFFDYKPEYTGGGVYFKLSNYLFQNNILFYLISFISMIILVQLVINNYQNLFILLLVFLNNPQETIYHKYFDPFLIILFFLIFNLKIDIQKLKLNINFIAIYLYFLSFLIISYFKIYFV